MYKIDPVERERLEHNIIRAFHHWDDKPNNIRLNKLSKAVQDLREYYIYSR